MRLLIYSWRAILGIAISGPIATAGVAQTPPTNLCGASPCVSTNDDYAQRLIMAWNSPITTVTERAKMMAFVAAHKNGEVIDWKSAATEYFGWRNGKPYIANAPAPYVADDFSPIYRTLVESAILDQLVDPESAKFKWPYEFTYGEWRTPRKYDGYLTCGLVNSRNRMGGFTGYQYFSVVMKDDQISYLNMDSGAGRGLNSYLCQKASDRLKPRS